MVGDVAPFVQVDYMDKDAHEHTGIILLDSGSTANILSPEMANCIGQLCKLEAKDTISSIAEEVMDVDKVKFSFAFGGFQFHETFCISRQKLPIPVKGMKVVGILGNQFLQKHQLVIDYSDHTLHTSMVSPHNLSSSDCSFFFPMEIGLKYYGLPVLPVKQNGRELVTLVDSGAIGNMITKKALVDNEFKCLYYNEKDTMMGITGEVDVEEAHVRFNMLSIDGDDVCEVSRHDRFSVLPCNIFTFEEECDENGEQMPPIEVLIGSPFMAKEGWILDFGAKIMYKLKAA